MTQNDPHMNYKLIRIIIASVVSVPVLLFLLKTFGYLAKLSKIENGLNKFNVSEKTVVLGIGSGRCGTLAFSKLLDQQLFSDISHEYNHCNKFKKSWRF